MALRRPLQVQRRVAFPTPYHLANCSWPESGSLLLIYRLACLLRREPTDSAEKIRAVMRAENGK